MSGTRWEASVEGRAARSAVGAGLFAGALAAAVWMALVHYWPVEWAWPDEEERDRILLYASGGLAALAVWRLGGAVVHTRRWVKARRWERMLADPSSAHLVPPLEAHARSVSRASVARLRATALVAALVAIGTFAYAAVAAIDRAEAGGTDTTDDVGSVGVFGVLATWVSVAAWRSARRRRLARRLEELSERDPESTEGLADPSPPLPRSASIPDLRVMFQVRAEAAAASAPRTVGDERPLHVLYLRLFHNEAGTSRFLSGQWRRHGYIHLLRSADQVTRAEIEEAKDTRSVASLFISTPAEMEAALTRQETGRHDPPPPSGIVAHWRWLRDRERGTYPVRALLCHGSFWKQAIDLLLPRMDHVVLDLTGYQPRHAGTRYELQRVIDRYPIEQVSIIGGPAADRPFLTAQITWAWRQMAAGSPNEGRSSRTIVVSLPQAPVRTAA